METEGEAVRVWLSHGHRNASIRQVSQGRSPTRNLAMKLLGNDHAHRERDPPAVAAHVEP